MRAHMFNDGSEEILRYKERRRLLQSHVRKSMEGFAFTSDWLETPDGLWMLLRHCKVYLREKEVLVGSSLNALNYLTNGIEDVMVGKQRTLPWVQFIDSMKAQGHIARKAPPSSMQAIFAVFLCFPLDGREWHISIRYTQPRSPWLLLKPLSNESLTLLELVIRAFMEE